MHGWHIYDLFYAHDRQWRLYHRQHIRRAHNLFQIVDRIAFKPVGDIAFVRQPGKIYKFYCAGFIFETTGDFIAMLSPRCVVIWQDGGMVMLQNQGHPLVFDHPAAFARMFFVGPCG